MKKYKYGFTLIELLAVIVILAIVSLIAIPLVGLQIESSKKAAFKDSVLEASKGLEIYLNRNQIKMIPGVDEGSGVSIKVLKDEDLISKLTDGKFVEIDEKTYSYFITDGNYCAYGPLDNLVINKNCESLDPTEPVIDDGTLSLSSTTNSIIAIVDESKIYDNEFNNVTYTLNLYIGSKKVKSQKEVEKQNTYTFDDLKENTILNIKCLFDKQI